MDIRITKVSKELDWCVLSVIIDGKERDILNGFVAVSSIEYPHKDGESILYQNVNMYEDEMNVGMWVIEDEFGNTLLFEGVMCIYSHLTVVGEED